MAVAGRDHPADRALYLWGLHRNRKLTSFFQLRSLGRLLDILRLAAYRGPFTLPATASAGTVFTFCVQEAQQFRVDPGTATIRDTSGQTADKYKWADAVGECITLIADSNSDWVVSSKDGFWTEEA